MTLLLGGLAEGDKAITFFVHVTGNTANGAALARRVPTLEDDDHARLGFFQILLQPDQLGLVRLETLLLAPTHDGTAVFALTLR